MMVYIDLFQHFQQHSIEQLVLLAITGLLLALVSTASCESLIASKPHAAPLTYGSHWNPYVTYWYMSTITLVTLQLITSTGTASLALYSIAGWSLLGVLLISMISPIISSIATYVSITPSSISLNLDVQCITGASDLLNTLGSWLYSVLYLTLRMWLVFALHGFCTGCISELVTLTATQPILGITALIAAGVCTIAYVSIQSYVYTSFVVMYLASDVLSYYTLISVTLCLALPWSLSVTSTLVVLCLYFSLHTSYVCLINVCPCVQHLF